MSRKKKKDKKARRNSPSCQRYAQRQRALSILPMKQTGLGDSKACAMVKSGTVTMLSIMLESMPKHISSKLQLIPELRRRFAQHFADRMFSVGNLFEGLYPEFFPVVDTDSKGLVVRWTGMKSVSTPRGLHYLPGLGVPVLYRGVELTPKFTTHAIQRILQRAQKVPASWHAHDRTFRRVNLQTGALVPWEDAGELIGFALWDATPNDHEYDYSPDANRVDDQFPLIDPRAMPKFEVWRLVGYLPCEIRRSSAVCRTLLYPGMRSTPEAKCGLDESLTELSAAELSKLPEEQQYELLRKLHACTPQFRRFTDDEARAAGNTWVATARTDDRHDFLKRRRTAVFRKMEYDMALKRTA